MKFTQEGQIEAFSVWHWAHPVNLKKMAGLVYPEFSLGEQEWNEQDRQDIALLFREQEEWQGMPPFILEYHAKVL